MPDLALTAPPPRPELLRQLRLRLGDAAPGLRLLAEGLLGADSPIDFVGIDAEGRAVIILVGDPGGDLELVTRGLAQKAWVGPRLRDWLQLAPKLGVRPELGVRLLHALRRLHGELRWRRPGALDWLVGTRRLRLALERGDSVEAILAADRPAIEAFEHDRREALLY